MHSTGQAFNQELTTKNIHNPKPIIAHGVRSWTAKASSLISAGFQLYSDHEVKKRFRRLRNFRGAHEIDSRVKGSKNLLLIAAGYKPGLLPLTLERVARFTPPTWDICLCCAGLDSTDIRSTCAQKGWSYLTTKKNQISLAQNLAISAHPAARSIVKMDEDIFLVEGTLAGLLSSLEEAESAGPFQPGLMAPLLNVNGYSSRILLEKLDRLTEFEKRFGPCRQTCTNTPVWKDPAAAKFLWEILLPFDETAANLASHDPEFSACPHRFSIGCFVLHREFWEAMQGFSVAPPGTLGVDEIDLCSFCNASSRPVLVAHHLLAGHAGFGHQMEMMEPWLVKNF